MVAPPSVAWFAGSRRGRGREAPGTEDPRGGAFPQRSLAARERVAAVRVERLAPGAEAVRGGGEALTGGAGVARRAVQPAVRLLHRGAPRRREGDDLDGGPGVGGVAAGAVDVAGLRRRDGGGDHEGDPARRARLGGTGDRRLGLARCGPRPPADRAPRPRWPRRCGPACGGRPRTPGP